MPNDRPNILVILSDQHAPRQLGCYGDELIHTPNLDRLAAEGMRFDNAYCPSPLCVPSRMAFMTGRRPSTTGMLLNQSILPSGIPTWAHHLAVAGYETTLIGRMHFVGPDQRHGFMHRPIGENAAKYPGSPELGGPRYQRIPRATAGQNRPVFEYAGCGPSYYQHQDRHVTDHACEFLHQHANADQPFAAVVGYMMPHCPFIGPKDLFEYYFDRVNLPEFNPQSEPEHTRQLYRERQLLDPPPTPHQLRVARAAYYAMCAFTDQQVGRVLAAVDQAGLRDNTLVIYASDHGEMAGEHGLWAKKSFYEQSVRVPLIARWPGTIPAGREQPTICNLYDLAPTFCDLAQREPNDMDGSSLMPQLSGQHDLDRWTLSEVVDTGNQHTLRHLGRMVRRGPWKYFQGPRPNGEPFEPVLFDVEEDPAERRNLVADCPVPPRDLAALLDAGWDPTRIAQTCHQQTRDYQTIVAWGKAVQRQHEDAFVNPGPEIEQQMEIRSLQEA